LRGHSRFEFDSATAFTAAELRPTSSWLLSSWPSFLPSPCWLSSCRV